MNPRNETGEEVSQSRTQRKKVVWVARHNAAWGSSDVSFILAIVVIIVVTVNCFR
jgi:hypothetical protein